MLTAVRKRCGREFTLRLPDLIFWISLRRWDYLRYFRLPFSGLSYLWIDWTEQSFLLKYWYFPLRHFRTSSLLLALKFLLGGKLYRWNRGIRRLRSRIHRPVILKYILQFEQVSRLWFSMMGSQPICSFLRSGAKYYCFRILWRH